MHCIEVSSFTGGYSHLGSKNELLTDTLLLQGPHTYIYSTQEVTFSAITDLRALTCLSVS